MADQLGEIKRNLCEVGQFDLADALGPESTPQGGWGMFSSIPGVLWL